MVVKLLFNEGGGRGKGLCVDVKNECEGIKRPARHDGAKGDPLK
jgi:hypothetical protein